MREAKDYPAIAECVPCGYALLWYDPAEAPAATTCSCNRPFTPTEFGIRSRRQASGRRLLSDLLKVPGA